VRQWDVSHLCHKPNCFNPDHLAVEHHRDNMLRRQCALAGRCVCGLPTKCLLD
jgi:Zinc-binding loop region of homing endonuclease